MILKAEDVECKRPRKQSDHKITPSLLPQFTKNPILSISCGNNHTLVLDQLGNIFSCGQGSQGALGYGRGANSNEFKKIKMQRDSMKN